MVQVVLDESAEILRAARGVLITRTRHGPRVRERGR